MVKLSQYEVIVKLLKQTTKRFSEKPIVAFTNSTVFILDFYITKSLVSCFDFERLDFEESSYSQLPGSLSADNKYLHVRNIPHQLNFTSQTIPDCIGHIIGVLNML